MQLAIRGMDSLKSFAKNYNLEIIRMISHKKGEPEWMLEWRLKAFEFWQTMNEPEWAKLLGIDFEGSKYKHRFILRKRDKQGHRPRSQYISESAFTDGGYQKIINKIKIIIITR